MLNYLKLPNQTPKDYFHSQCFSKQIKIRDYKNANYVIQGCSVQLQQLHSSYSVYAQCNPTKRFWLLNLMVMAQVNCLSCSIKSQFLLALNQMKQLKKEFQTNTEDKVLRVKIGSHSVQGRRCCDEDELKRDHQNTVKQNSEFLIFQGYSVIKLTNKIWCVNSADAAQLDMDFFCVCLLLTKSKGPC